MKFRLRFSLRLLLGCTVVISIVLASLVFHDSQRRRSFKSLQDRGVILDTELQTGYWPSSIASVFPAAFAEPRTAWICFADSGQFILLGDVKVEETNAKSELEKLISDANAAGFTQVRFARVTSYGFLRHSYFDAVKLFPNIGDGKYWSMPADQYPIQMARNKRTFGLER